MRKDGEGHTRTHNLQRTYTHTHAFTQTWVRDCKAAQSVKAAHVGKPFLFSQCKPELIVSPNDGNGKNPYSMKSKSSRGIAVRLLRVSVEPKL